ncbi:MAG TPA: MFS transporter [Nitrososphaerales archaeon]|nr:MFS transporter [Nitrososphaerales archaeon]
MEAETPGIIGLSRTLFLNRNIRIIAITGLISGIYIGMLNLVLQLFPLSLGFGVFIVGILQALGNRFSGVAATIVQPIAGHYSDVHSRKQSILLGSAATILSMLSFVGAALTANGFLMFLAFILFGVSILGSPASQALVAESVDLNPKRMNVAYSLVFFLSTIPGIISPYLAGAISDNYGYVAIFAAAALLEGVDLYLYWRELSETKHTMITDSAQGRSFSLREALRLPKASAGYYGALAMDAFAFGISTSIIYAMAKYQFGFSNADIGLLVSILNIAILVSQYPATRILIWLGAKKTIILSEALGTLLMAGWALSKSLPEFAVFSVVFGVSVTTWVPGVQSLAMTHSAPGERGSVGGKIAAFRGLVAFPAPIIGGFLYQGLGYEAPIIASFAGTIVCLALMFRFLPGRPQPSTVGVSTQAT